MRIWSARCLIGLVFFFNVQCALVFLWQPDTYAPSFELAGIGGQTAVQGMGILFLMWNIPYLFALIHPRRNRLSLLEAVLMQALGAGGETLLLVRLRMPPVSITTSLTRFILFDVAGLVALLAALVISWNFDKDV